PETEEAEGEAVEETVEDTTEDAETTQQDTKQGDLPSPTTQNDVNVCSIVDKILTGSGNLNEACTLKYGTPNRYWGWRCVAPSGENTTTREGESPTRRVRSADSGEPTSDKGAICVPPRRRKLYTQKLHDWATTSVETQTSGQKTPSDNKLREAFIQSAAVETFFLWHKYKEEKKPPATQDGSQLQTPDGNSGGDENDKDPQEELKQGTIPDGFLRQMFYTLGDYRDILVRGGDTNGGNNIILNASGNKEDMEKMQIIQKKIKDIMQKQNGDTPGEKHNSKREQFWKQHGKYIWEGMLCALTYDTNSGGEDKKIEQVKTADNGKNLFDKLKNGNDYEKVKLEDTSGDTQALSPGTSLTGDKTYLSKFVLRPPYFRYLEEWGETFCRQRTRMLDKIIFECRNSEQEGKRHCSGDGYDCEKIKPDNYENISDLNCRGCGEQCMKYKKWIDIKFDEYQNQKSKYEEEKQKLNGNSNGGGDNKEFCKKIQNQSTTAAQFLAALKHCKNHQNSENKGNQEEEKKNEIDFDDLHKTFSRSTYCKACPVYGVTCPTNGKRKCKPKDEPANKDNTVDGEPTTIPILINDGSINNATNGATDGSTDGATKDSYEELKNCSKKYSLFKGLSKQEWKCQKKKGVYQCNLENFKNDTYFDKDIVFNEFFQRWLRYFVHDYNILKHKIDPCIKKEKQDKTEHKCINGCNIKCDCVDKWLDKKSTEWDEIKSLYKQYSNITEQTIAYRIKSYFELLYFDSDYKRAQKVVEKPCDKEKLWGCTGENIKDGKEEQCKNGDFITNLISKLQKKIEEFKKKPSGSEQCTTPPSNLEDDEQPLEETEENTEDAQKMIPKICDGAVPTEPAEPEGKCEEDDKNVDGGKGEKPESEEPEA
ncbi:hypothetical protein PFAG_06156, partial [Plasmodium falciparum Santa Lucia]